MFFESAPSFGGGVTGLVRIAYFSFLAGFGVTSLIGAKITIKDKLKDITSGSRTAMNVSSGLGNLAKKTSPVLSLPQLSGLCPFSAKEAQCWCCTEAGRTRQRNINQKFYQKKVFLNKFLVLCET